jgi:hypothetical protein
VNTYGPPILWDDPVGGCGLKQFEISLGREWPLPNSVLNLPLFGADEAPISPPSSNPGKCGDGACDNGECFTVTDNDGTGHFGTQTLGNGKGYYSFQCFNPMGYCDAFVNGSEYENKPKSIPTCSIWSFANAIWNRAWRFGAYGANEGEEIAYPNPVYLPFTRLLAADPSGLTNGGESNVTAYLRELKNGMFNHDEPQSVIMPNVFLWDRENYILAADNASKWKHIYFIGNANVIFDTQCMFGTFFNTLPYSEQDSYGFVIHLDEVSHDATYGTSGNARLFGFYGCNKDEPFNLGSKANFGLKTMDCAILNDNPKGGVSNYCAECANENPSGLGKLGGANDNCYHIGHSEDCSIEGGVQGL